MSSTLDKNNDHLSQDLQGFRENLTLTHKISDIQKSKGRMQRMKKFKELHTDYATPLSYSHIAYYEKKERKALLHQISLFLTSLLILLSFFFLSYRISVYYQRFHHLDVSENTLEKAISYYQEGDYEAAFVRFQKLYHYGWDSYTVVHYLSEIYQMQNNYDAAAELLLENLIHGYGIQNVTTNHKIFIKLRDLWANQLLSEDVFSKVGAVLDQVHGYASLYTKIYTCIVEENYEDADYYCQILQQAGANSFIFTSYRTTVLLNTGRISEAYQLVMKTVRSHAQKIEKKISMNQRRSLVTYLIPYLEDEETQECTRFLQEQIKFLNVIDDSDIAEPFIPYDEVEFLLTTNDSIRKLNYVEPYDNIVIKENTTFLHGKEGYDIRIEHRDGTQLKNHYFFMDMEQQIFLLMDGKYHPLPVDEPSDSGETSGSIERNYCQFHNPSITLNFTYDITGTGTYLIQDTSSGNILYYGQASSTSPYQAFSYFTMENAAFTIFFTGEDAILFVTKDPEGKYADWEGRYSLVQKDR